MPEQEDGKTMSGTMTELPAEENGRLSKRYSFRPATRLWVAVAAFLCLPTLLSPAVSHAEIQQHFFDISGSNGENGLGWFTWDDQVVPDGSPVAASLSSTGDIIELRIQISGGNVIGGTTVFELPDCVGAFLENAPAFNTDINFVCNNAVNTLSGFSPKVNYLNDTDDGGAGVRPPVLGPNSSALDFTARQTRARFNSLQPIPAVPLWAIFLLVAVLPLAARRYLPLR